MILITIFISMIPDQVSLFSKLEELLRRQKVFAFLKILRS